MGFRLNSDHPMILKKLRVQTLPLTNSPPEKLNIQRWNKSMAFIHQQNRTLKRRSACTDKCIDASNNIKSVDL